LLAAANSLSARAARAASATKCRATRIDAEAKRLGISRTAWLHVAAHEKLKRERE
jgi:hypothetical protein